MVDVSGKEVTARVARAEAVVHVGPDLAATLAEAGMVEKGNVIETARLAGIMAAKRTADLIPLCHPLPLDRVDVDGSVGGERVRITCVVRCHGRTGVEMEAMTGASVAALAVYDMCKSTDRKMEITDIRLMEKSGGKSGHYRAQKP